MGLEEEILQTDLGSVSKKASLMEAGERDSGCNSTRYEVEVGAKKAEGGGCVGGKGSRSQVSS